MADLASFQAIVHGRVHGVFFRASVQQRAEGLRLTGYVRNLNDGTVEMLAQGKAEDIDDCLSDIQQSLIGHIREVKIEEVPPNPTYTDFTITF